MKCGLWGTDTPIYTFRHPYLCIPPSPCFIRDNKGLSESFELSFFPSLLIIPLVTFSVVLHCDLVHILFLQTQRETDRFFDSFRSRSCVQHNQDRFFFWIPLKLSVVQSSRFTRLYILKKFLHQILSHPGWHPVHTCRQHHTWSLCEHKRKETS